MINKLGPIAVESALDLINSKGYAVRIRQGYFGFSLNEKEWTGTISKGEAFVTCYDDDELTMKNMLVEAAEKRWCGILWQKD